VYFYCTLYESQEKGIQRGDGMDPSGSVWGQGEGNWEYGNETSEFIKTPRMLSLKDHVPYSYSGFPLHPHTEDRGAAS